jgi:transposase-like protein
MGAIADGEKELIAVRDGLASWTELLNYFKGRGLKVDPQLAIGDCALGFWDAIRTVFMKIREKRCWFHKSGKTPAQRERIFFSIQLNVSSNIRMFFIKNVLLYGY